MKANVDDINNLSDIFLGLDLYEYVNLNEIIADGKIKKIDEIRKKLLSYTSYSFNGSSGNYATEAGVFSDFKKYIKKPEGTNIDSYCIECKKGSTFNFTDTAYISDEYFFITFLCSRCKKQKIGFTYKIDNDENLYKIGQYPSKVDLTINDIKKYEKLLGEKYYQELKESIILNSHGFGIGAFVHLRRIFEHLIFETFNENKDKIKEAKTDFLRLKMEGKIELLKSYLPTFLVEHKNIYGILSKHIHELEKKESLNNYPIIKGGLELILDEKIKLLEEKKKVAKLSKGINSISSSIK